MLDVVTTRATGPTRRALRISASKARLRTIRIAPGSPTSTSIRVDCGGPARIGRDAAAADDVDRIEPAARDDEQAVAVEEQLVARAVRELQGAHEARLVCAHVDGEEPVGADDVDRRAVRLDEVGLVDALLLHVRRRVVHARHGRARVPRGAGRRRCRHRGGDARPPRRRARRRPRAAAHAASRTRAAPGRSRTAATAGSRASSRPRRARPSAGGEHRQGEHDHDRGDVGGSSHLTRYTPPEARMSPLPRDPVPTAGCPRSRQRSRKARRAGLPVTRLAQRLPGRPFLPRTCHCSHFTRSGAGTAPRCPCAATSRARAGRRPRRRWPCSSRAASRAPDGHATSRSPPR